MGANLASANLRSAKLFDANFTEASLSGAKLRRRASLTFSNLTGADFTEAILSGAKVVEVRGLFPGAIGQGLRRPNDFTFCRPHASRGLVAYLALAGTLSTKRTMKRPAETSYLSH